MADGCEGSSAQKDHVLIQKGAGIEGWKGVVLCCERSKEGKEKVCVRDARREREGGREEIKGGSEAHAWEGYLGL